MTDTAVIVKGEERDPALALDRVIVAGDLSKLSPTDRVTYYRTVCESMGLNPFTRPFEYIVLNGKLTLYASKSCTDQLRSLRSISIDSAERDASDPDYATWLVTGHDATGRTDMEIGSVHIAGVKGEARANAIMKALTKGKRRLTLSLSGLGWLDETEVGSVPSAEGVDVDQDTGEIRRLPLREQVASRAAAITSGPRAERPEPRLPSQAPDAGQEEEHAGAAGAVAVSGVAPLPVEPAGARTATSAHDSEPSSAEASSVNSAPKPAPDTDCTSRSPYGDDDRCTLPLGHRNAHRGAEATWT